MKKTKTSSNAFKTGSYSALLTVIVILIALFINILFSALPSKATELDLSSKKLFSVTATTKAVLSGINEEVDIYQIAQSGKEDQLLTKFLGKYSEYSSKINYEIINPDVYPTFAKNYTDGEVANNDVIVECGDRYKYISTTQIYDIDTSEYYTNGTYKTFFDGESELTSAIDYVTRDDLPKLYILTGHGEPALSEPLKNAIEKANIEYEEISLISKGSIPADADMIMLWGIQSDISEPEKDIIEGYLHDGGKMVIGTDAVEQGLLDNQTALLDDLGLKLQEGFLFETDNVHTALGFAYVVIPEVQEHDINKDLLENNYKPVMPVVQGVRFNVANENVMPNVEKTALLKSSTQSFSKVDGYKATSITKEDNDISGPLNLAAVVENDKSKVLWVGGTMFTQSQYDSYSSGANIRFIMNAFSWLSEEQTYSIVSKSVDYDYLTINDSQAAMLKIIMLIVIPVAFLIFGILDLIFRRKLK